MPKTNADRVTTTVIYDSEAKHYAAVVLYDAPRSKKLRELKRYPYDPNSDDHIAQHSAYTFAEGFIAGLDAR